MKRDHLPNFANTLRECASGHADGTTVVDLSAGWLAVLAAQPETGMGYQIVSVVLMEGTRYDQVAVVEGRIVEVKGYDEIPFTEGQIAEMIVTHDKWDFDGGARQP